MKEGALGQVYQDGDAIVRQGECGDCMYVVQEGRIRIYVEKDGKEVLLREPKGDEIVIGEMALFGGDRVRSATVRAHGRARVLTVDKKAFLRRVHEDPSLALTILRTLSQRVRELSDEVARLSGRQDGGD